MEAQELERMEAELLRKLQETQQRERDAFNQLEQAMINSSLPKKMRVGPEGQSQSSQRTTSSKK